MEEKQGKKRPKFFLGCKGSAQDVVLIGALLFVFGLGFFIIHFVMSTAVDQLVVVPAINESGAATTAFSNIKLTLARLDYVVLGLFIGLTLALIITGWFIAGNPIFMFIYFIVVVIAVVLSTLLANVWNYVSQSAQFGSTVAHFAITNNLLLRLPIYVAIVGFVGLVVIGGG